MNSNSGSKIGNWGVTGPFNLKLHFIYKTILLSSHATHASSKISTFSDLLLQLLYLEDCCLESVPGLGFFMRNFRE